LVARIASAQGVIVKHRISFMLISAALMAVQATAQAKGDPRAPGNRCIDLKTGRVIITDSICPGGTKASEVDSKGMSARVVDTAVLAYTNAWLAGDADGLARTTDRTDVAFLDLHHRLTDPRRRDETLAALKYTAPRNVTVARRELSPEAERATVYVNAQVIDLLADIPVPTRGIVRLKRTEGQWRVEGDEWGERVW
jgi:hypothetical protein